MVCPICQKQFNAVPALSRRDNTTKICPICATREALDDAGIMDGSELREGILKTVSNAYADQGIKVPKPGGEHHAERDQNGSFMQKLH